MNARNVKELIRALSRAHGFHRVSIGSLAQLEDARLEYEEWLQRGFAAGMEYLKRNPEFRTSPALLYPGSKSAIIVAVSYFTELPEEPPFQYYGRVARYAVGLDYHAVIRSRLRSFTASLEEAIGRPLLAKAYSDDVALHEQSFAARHGVGFAGRNTLIIGPKLSGSYYFLAELFSDLELDADGPYLGTCGTFFRCGNQCPTGAIKPEGQVDANLCISYLTIENKACIPVELRSQIGKWVFGCDICQEVCPYNQRPSETLWSEFQPDKGVGHYLDLESLLTLTTEEQFRQKFGHTPLRRPKRRGLLRNALVVIGNYFREARQLSTIDHATWRKICQISEKLELLITAESDSMLREHALWSLALSPAASKRQVTQIIGRETDDLVIGLMRKHLAEMS